MTTNRVTSEVCFVITGGLGYIGSHIVAALTEDEHMARTLIEKVIGDDSASDSSGGDAKECAKDDVAPWDVETLVHIAIVDDESRCANPKQTLQRLLALANKQKLRHARANEDNSDATARNVRVTLSHHCVDVRDSAALGNVFGALMARFGNIDCVVHCAGVKSVGESVHNPLLYYDINVGGTVALLGAMSQHAVQRIIFSSSATVYGAPECVPVHERCAVRPINPYGHSKAMCEQILCDWANAPTNDSLSTTTALAAPPKRMACILRYMNPVGAHASGTIGESPLGTPNNLMPLIAQVALGQRTHVDLLGNDYPTADGTGVRDYVHVVDLARAHVLAFEHLLAPGSRGDLACCHSDGARIFVLNVGRGVGVSVLELVRAFESESRRKIETRVRPRRHGDAASVFCDTSHIACVLPEWRAEHDVARMCADTWHFLTRTKSENDTSTDS